MEYNTNYESYDDWSSLYDGQDSYDVADVRDVTVLQGDGNAPPVQSDTTVQRSSTLQDLLNGAGNLANTARDIGTAVGTVQRQVALAGPAYTQARTAAASGNSLGTWWQYASTTDKLMVGLAVVGIIVALKD